MTSDRHAERTPDAIALLALAVVAGAVQVTSAGYTAPVVSAIGPAWAGAWAVSLTAAGVVALVGITWPRPVIGRLLELAGRLGVAVTAAAYTVAIGTAGRPWDVLVLAFTMALAVASAVRVVQVAARLRHWWVRVRAEVLP